MTRAPAIPANRATSVLYICIWRWRSPGSLLPFNGCSTRKRWVLARYRRESGGRETDGRRDPYAASAASAKSGQFRIVCSGWPASRRLAQDGRSAAAVRVVVVVMEARSVPIDTPAAEYRPWRLTLSLSRVVVTHPEVDASACAVLDRPRWC